MTTPAPAAPVLTESQVMADRKAKFDALAASGAVMYPNDFRPTHTTAQVVAAHGHQDAAALEGVTQNFTLAGRVMALRLFGKLAFLQLQDEAGRLQVSLSVDGVGAETFDLFKAHTDVGDLMGVSGTLMRTKTGELTLKAGTFRLLNKTLRPLPDKFHGLSDVETRYRQRYVDLIVNAEVRDTFRKRSAIVQALRTFLAGRGFMEVETPMLQVQAGGAAARPFKTHHNALDLALTLRIAPELYLKRLVVGGFEKVFEINRNFRNEGVSVRHNPEFTMLEAYGAHMNYHDMMDFTEEMITTVAQEVCGTLEIPYGEHTVSLKRPWTRLTMRDALIQIGGAKPDELETLDSLKALAAKHKVHLKAHMDYGHAFTELFEALCESKLINPTFIYDYPKAVSPLARSHDDRPEWAQRSEFFIVGREHGNLFSELNDPAEQAARFAEQVAQAQKGDDEAMPYDHDYIRALEYGLLPTAGLGVGIDRLVMLLTNQPSIREVILFPTLRPE